MKAKKIKFSKNDLCKFLNNPELTIQEDALNRITGGTGTYTNFSYPNYAYVQSTFVNTYAKLAPIF